MIKKIAYLIISVVILVTGYFAFQKLGYWDKSIAILKFNSAQSYGGRPGRGFEGRGEFRQNDGFRRPEGGRNGEGRQDFRNLPDSIRQRFEARRFDGERGRNMPDSVRLSFAQNGRAGHGMDEGRLRGGEGRERGEFRGGRRIYLNNVAWFLAVFSSFTVVALFLDKLCVRLFHNILKRPI
jgi:hypothetical protein